MKKSISLFLFYFFIVTLLHNISLTNSVNYEKFIHIEELEIDEIKPRIDRNNQNESINKYCFPIYNSSSNNSKKIPETIYGFKYQTNLFNYVSGNVDLVFDVVIFNKDFSRNKNTDVYDLVIKETCQNHYERANSGYFKDITITCQTKEFLKDDVISICTYNNNVMIGKQKSLVRASGFTKKKEKSD